MRQQSISVYFVKRVLNNAVRQGLNPVDLLRQNRISPRLLDEDDARISIERFADLQVATMVAMNDESLGYGNDPLPIGSWSMMCHAVINCDTLGKALARYCRFFALFQHNSAQQLIDCDDHVCLRLQPIDGSAAPSPYLSEISLFNSHRFASWLVQELLPLKSANFVHSTPAHVREYRPMFAANPVAFDQPHTELVINRMLLDKPVTQNEQSLQRYLRHPVLWMLTEQYDRESWTVQVKNALRKDMQNMPELDELAAAFELHPQTLRRRLAREGSSFSEIKSQLRRDVALHFLGKQGLSIEEIAHRAGFSESSAFIRAFKGWTGVTPYTYRKGL